MEVLQIYWGRESCCLVLVSGLSSSLVLARVRALLDYVRTTAAAEVLRARYPHLSPCCIVMPDESPTRSEIEQRSLARPLHTAEAGEHPPCAALAGCSARLHLFPRAATWTRERVGSTARAVLFAPTPSRIARYGPPCSHT